MKNATLVIAGIMIFFSSCFIPAQQAFYLSPQHATAQPYKVMPTIADSVSSATYVNFTGTAGGANHRLRDGVLGLQASIHQARHWKHFQTFYGSSFSVGIYDVGELTVPANHIDAGWINANRGSKSQGSYGFQGGVNYVVPFRHGEWRMLGVEANFQREFGEYYRFRQELPADGANIIDRNRWFNTFAITTDFVTNASDGSRIGYKFAYVQSFTKLEGTQPNGSPLSGYPRYASNTLHITVNRWTGYGQANFGSDAVNFQFGMTKRLGR